MSCAIFTPRPAVEPSIDSGPAGFVLRLRASTRTFATSAAPLSGAVDVERIVDEAAA